MTIKKIMYIIGTGCNIILFVYILICAIIDSYQLWPWGQLMSILGFNYLINTHKHSFTGELFNQYKKRHY